MSKLSYIETEKLATLFGIKNGYVFDYVTNHNKNKTRELILDATGIDIYNNEEFKYLSQEKCIRKIWQEYDDYTNGKLIKTMIEYYEFVKSDSFLEENEHLLLQEIRAFSNKLVNSDITIPDSDIEILKVLKSEIENNIKNNMPESSLDRLHTYATKYLRTICQKHDIEVKNNNNDYLPIQSLAGKMKKWYENNNYFDSEFCVIAIQNTINIFDKFNELRNNKSLAHPNALLKKEEAKYAVNIVLATLMFIDKIEELKSNKEMRSN